MDNRIKSSRGVPGMVGVICWRRIVVLCYGDYGVEHISY